MPMAAALQKCRAGNNMSVHQEGLVKRQPRRGPAMHAAQPAGKWAHRNDVQACKAVCTVRSRLFRKMKRGRQTDRMTDGEALTDTHLCTENKITSHLAPFVLYIRHNRAKREVSYCWSKYLCILSSSNRERTGQCRRMCGDTPRRERGGRGGGGVGNRECRNEESTDKTARSGRGCAHMRCKTQLIVRHHPLCVRKVFRLWLNPNDI